MLKKKIILSTSFIVSLIPMLLNQYGGLKGVQEITGLINLLNPIGIVLSEIYKFFTWHVMTITGEISIQNSVELAFSEFYVGLVVSLAMVFVYFVIDKKLNITTM